MYNELIAIEGYGYLVPLSVKQDEVQEFLKIESEWLNRFKETLAGSLSKCMFLWYPDTCFYFTRGLH